MSVRKDLFYCWEGRLQPQWRWLAGIGGCSHSGDGLQAFFARMCRRARKQVRAACQKPRIKVHTVTGQGRCQPARHTSEVRPNGRA